MAESMATRRGLGVVKKLRLRNEFPGQTHFPEVSPPLGLPTIIALIALAIVVTVAVWWLRG